MSKSLLPTPVPQEYSGKWIAWSADGLRIVASGRTLDQATRAAAKAGEAKPIFEKVPLANARRKA